MSKTYVLLLLAIVTVSATVPGAPPMGYFASTDGVCWLNQGYLKVLSDYQGHTGMIKSGYDYFILGDCWQAEERMEDTTLAYNNVTFSEGITKFVDYIKANGQKVGLTLGGGSKTCLGFPGSLDHEYIDAGKLQNWGVEYLRYQNCYPDGVSATQRFTKMGEALNFTETINPIYYAMDNWGDSKAATWAPDVAHSWGTTIPYTLAAPHSNAWTWVANSFIKNSLSAFSAGPGRYNNPGELLVGRGLLTADEEATQFALWAVAKAPLMYSANMTEMSFASQAILQNPELIAINQGVQNKQATCSSGCVLSETILSSTSSWQTTVLSSDAASIVVIAVNWDDTTAQTAFTYDLVSNGIAFSKYDSCSTKDLYTGVTTNHNGASQNWGDIAPHAHVAKMVSCSPF